MILPIIQQDAIRVVAVTLIVLTTVYAVSISGKVKITEAATGKVLYKKLFLKFLQYSHENTCVGVSFLIKFQALSPVTLLKRDSKTGVFM